MNRRLPTRATAALIIALFAACTTPITFLVSQASEKRDVARIQDLRQARVADAARADEVMCQENNRQDAVLTALLRSNTESRKFESSRPPLALAEKRLLRDYLEKLAPRDCGRLSSSKPFKR